MNKLYIGENKVFLKEIEKKEKKYDLIYIDPPYNTKNKKFLYDDNKKSSIWIKEIEDRLKIAKKILKTGGLIAISVDYHSVFLLKPLLDKIFSLKNFVADIVVETGNANGVKTAHKDKTIIKVKEYLLLYTNDKRKFRINTPYEYVSEYDKEYNIIFKEGKRFTYNTYRRLYNINDNKILKEIELGKIEAFRSMRDFDKQTKRHESFINEYVKLYEYESAGVRYEVRYTYSNSGSKLYLRRNLNNGKIDMLVNKLEKVENGKVKIIKGDLWKGYNKHYGNIDKEGGVVFKNGKKSLQFMIDVINLHPNKDAKVLDFYAGSGTTGEATLLLNKKDGGSRKFTLITNNENDIAEKITIKRMNNIKIGYGKQKGIKFDLEIIRKIKENHH